MRGWPKVSYRLQVNVKCQIEADPSNGRKENDHTVSRFRYSCGPIAGYHKVALRSRKYFALILMQRIESYKRFNTTDI